MNERKSPIIVEGTLIEFLPQKGKPVILIANPKVTVHNCNPEPLPVVCYDYENVALQPQGIKNLPIDSPKVAIYMKIHHGNPMVSEITIDGTTIANNHQASNCPLISDVLDVLNRYSVAEEE